MSDSHVVTAEQFVRQVYLTELPSITTPAGVPHYLRFVLVCACIESLAEIVSPNVNGAHKRFNAVLARFADSTYSTYTCVNAEQCHWSNDRNRPQLPTRPCLYHSWRCGMLHRLRTRGVALTDQEQATDKGIHHFDRTASGSVVLVSEKLMDDFRAMCEQILNDPSLQNELQKPWLKVGSP